MFMMTQKVLVIHFAPLIGCTGEEFLSLPMVYTQKLSVLMRHLLGEPNITI